MAVHLSKRMEALARMVTPGNRLCDVGCDHGFLPIYLVQQKLIPSAIAMDIGEGPLMAARTHIAEAGLETVITTRRSDGLAQVSEDETDTILIAGMGGGIVIHILTEGRSVARKVKELILQPQSELEEVRRFLFSENYELLQEDMILEDGKYYPMMKVRYAPEKFVQQSKPTDGDFCLDRCFCRHIMQCCILICCGSKESKRCLKQLASQKQTPAIVQRTKEVEAHLQLVEQSLW